MKVTIAIDSFKGSMTSMEAGNAAAEGVRRAYPRADLCVRPLADGGEGTVEALVAGLGGSLHTVTVTGPLGSPVECPYGICTINARKVAVLEMAGAAGITRIPPEQRNPLDTTTYGVGEVIRDAIFRGCRHFIVGIGGSATNDGGIGMLQALGFDLRDRLGAPVGFGARGLSGLYSISNAHVLPQLAECEFHIACDVTNPLCGENGCSAVYGPQKGAGPELIAQMDRWLLDYAELTRKYNRSVRPEYPGAGAAGGLGFAFMAFTNAVLEPGIDMILRETNLEADIRDADVVITGEGRLDGQTVMGKAPVGVARLAKKHGKMVLGFAGSVTKDAAACNSCGIDAFFPILRRVLTLGEAMENSSARENMTDTVEQVFRLMKAAAVSFRMENER